MPRLKTVVALAVAAVALAVALPSQAFALDPDSAVGGNGSKWFSGTLLMQSGQNCSILGAPYSETMVSAIAGYGGAPGGGAVKVGDAYWAKLLISIPGTPCGTGVSLVATDLTLPKGTSYDPSRPIRCFGHARSGNVSELTGGSWTLPTGSSGPYCPTTVGSSLTGQGGLGVGYRPLANGQMFEIFVPIKSTQELKGAAANPVDEIRWTLSSSGTYDGIGATKVWTNVFAAGTPTDPYIYFQRTPAAVPYWDTAAPAGEHNKVEWFANLYSAGLTGTLCFDLYAGSSASGAPIAHCGQLGGNWNGTITTQSDLWQVQGGGPNGGFTPYYYDFNQTYTLRWRFTPSSGPVVYSAPVTFTTLPSPDADGDGVADVNDACPSVAGTQADGCQPGVVTDPDGDGVFGGLDRCPAENGTGSLDGCPATGSTIDGAIGKLAPKIKRKALARGLDVPITCLVNSNATATLTISAAAARKLKLKTKKRSRTVAIGAAAANCAGTEGGILKLKLGKPAKSKLLKSRKPLTATLTVNFTRDGSPASTVTRALGIR
ncbi:MAG: hypothetical protein HZB14_07705 [Actinobacteria bacterium]|nr:hypothetical protein [Actinomycetota bacterium]